MLFGSSGIRRLYNQNLLSLALQVGMAVGSRADQVLVGMDSRTTGPALSSSFIAGICSTGAKTFEGGIAPTPSIAYCCRSFQAACMVTASHNPEPYNGLKLFNPDGSSFQAFQQDEIEEAISDTRTTDWLSQGKVMKYDPLTPHRDAILDMIHVKQDIPVILDCGNGAGSVLTPLLLSDAGASVMAVNANPSGIFSRPSEPLVEHLPYVPSLMKRINARCAVVHDGDADRMMAFDNTGTYIPGDLLLILFAKYLGSKRVVTTYDASMAVEEIAEVRRTPVGDAFVSEQLVQWGDFGGNLLEHGSSLKSHTAQMDPMQQDFSAKWQGSGILLKNSLQSQSIQLSAALNNSLSPMKYYMHSERLTRPMAFVLKRMMVGVW